VQFTNGGNEVELATVKSTANGFTNGEMFFDSSGNGTIGRLSPNGSLSNMNFATVSGNAFSGLYMDQSGSFGTNLIAGQGGGSVWLIKSNGVANQIVPAGGIEGDPEGIISLTNNGTNYGPWAGKIVTGLQGDVYDDCVIYAVSNMGVVSDYPSSFYPSLNMEVEDCDVIVTNQNLYVEDDADGWIVKVSSGVFTNHIGDVLITDSGYWDFVPALYIVHWNPATQSFVTTRISSPYINESIEQSTFAPINTPPVSP
jgi:hypothetical protein